MMGGQIAIDALTCQGIGGLAAVALGVMSADKGKPSAMGTPNVPLDPQVLGSLPQGPVEFTSEGNTFRIVLKDTAISINGLPVIPFGILTAFHGIVPHYVTRLHGLTPFSVVYDASFPLDIATVHHPRRCVAPFSLDWVPHQRNQEPEVAIGSIGHLWRLNCDWYRNWYGWDGQLETL